MKVNHINYPAFYHIPYRNDIQTYHKVSILINQFTGMKRHVEKAWGAHVLKKFMDLYSPEYVEIFNDLDRRLFNLEINETSLSEFANYNVFYEAKEVKKSSELKLYKIDNFFYKKYLLKYYNESNSLLDFYEQDYNNKMIIWRKIFNSFEN